MDNTSDVFGYYITIPAKVALDESLKPKARILFGFIANLSTQRGYCFASNSYLGRITGAHPDTISEFINDLILLGYLRRENVPNDRGLERRLFLVEASADLPTSAKVPNPRRRNDREGVGQTTEQNKQIDKSKENKQILPFLSANFAAVWSDWIADRAERKKKLTSRAIKGQFEFLAQYSEDVAIEIIKRSIKNSWTGLFPPDKQPELKKKMRF